MSEPTRAEQELAVKRIREWPHHERAAVVRLPKHERDQVLLLAALLDARPVEKEEGP